jgi:hypothetical protein
MQATDNVALDRFKDLFAVLADLDMTPIATCVSQAREPQPTWSAIWDSI